MAIYHCSTKPISRSSGRSATASIAYRSGTIIEDKRQGKVFDYTQRSGVIHAEMMTPNNIKISRSDLWNMAEETETRKNSRTAREFVIHIPHELMEQDKKKGVDLAREFSKQLKDRYGVVADFAVHAPDKYGDKRNYHAHILLTTRKLERLDSGRIALTVKSDLEQSNTQLKAQGKLSTQDEIKEIRKLWADVANKHLEQAGLNERIDHRSHAERGLDELPTIKMGWKATELERKGVSTDEGETNRLIQEYNLNIKTLHSLKVAEKAQAEMTADTPQQPENREPQQATQAKRGYDQERLAKAGHVISNFEAAVNQASVKIAESHNQQVIEQYEQAMREVEKERADLRTQIDNLGVRPALFGRGEWDKRHSQLEADWKQLNEKAQEVKDQSEQSKVDSRSVKKLAFNELSMRNPKARESYDRAMQYVKSVTEQRIADVREILDKYKSDKRISNGSWYGRVNEIDDIKRDYQNKPELMMQKLDQLQDKIEQKTAQTQDHQRGR